MYIDIFTIKASMISILKQKQKLNVGLKHKSLIKIKHSHVTKYCVLVLYSYPHQSDEPGLSNHTHCQSQGFLCK